MIILSGTWIGAQEVWARGGVGGTFCSWGGTSITILPGEGADMESPTARVPTRRAVPEPGAREGLSLRIFHVNHSLLRDS